MINWHSVKDKPLPRDNRGVFIALWKGCVCLTEYDEDEDRFYISMMPATHMGSWQVHQEREGKFTHWCEANLPEDY